MTRLTLKRVRELVLRHMHFVGPGLVSSVAYIDPGNWATDLSAGAQYGYSLLFVVFISGLAAVVLQLLSVRLGAVTTTSLPTQTRLLFERMERRRPRFKWVYRAGLYTLYALAEIAIVSTDLAELLGSAIALNLLFPSLPLYAGVLVTAADVLIVLLFFRSNSGRQGMLMFEILIVSLVLAVFVCFAILLHLVKPHWPTVFFGLVPSKTLVNPGALYVGVGIIGATVMPHALILGSALSGVDRLDMVPLPPKAPEGDGSGRWKGMGRKMGLPGVGKAVMARLRGRGTDTEEGAEGREGMQMELEVRADPHVQHLARQSQPERLVDQLAIMGSPSSLDTPGDELETPGLKERDLPVEGHVQPRGLGQDLDLDNEEDVSAAGQAWEKATRAYEHELRTFDRIKWVELHLLHATIDTSYSLLGFALTINAAILTLAGAAYYYGRVGPTDDADLPGAHALISQYIGKGAGLLFALSLLCAGQSASITATLAGQVVSEGFIQWRTSPMVRRMVTRLIGVIPAAIVASALGAKGLNTMLVASQVILSIILPTVIFPLVYIASREEVMTVEGPEVETEPERIAEQAAAAGRVAGGRASGVEADLHQTVPTQRHVHVDTDASTDTGARSSPSVGVVAGAGSGGFGIDAPKLSPSLTVERGMRSARTAPSSPSYVAAGPSHAGQAARETQNEQARPDENTIRPHPRRSKSFRSPRWVTVLGFLLFGVVVLANMYVIVELGLGNG